MGNIFLTLIEIREVPSGSFAGDVIKQTVTAWLTNQLKIYRR